MTEKRQATKATKVKCKRKESQSKQSIFVEYTLLWKKRLSFAGACWHFTKIDDKTRKIGQICIGNPMTTGFIM